MLASKQSNKTQLDAVHTQTAFAMSAKLEDRLLKLLTDGLGEHAIRLMDLATDCDVDNGEGNDQASRAGGLASAEASISHVLCCKSMSYSAGSVYSCMISFQAQVSQQPP